MRRRLCAAILAAWAPSLLAMAAEAPSPEPSPDYDFKKLFVEACMDNLGHPEKVRAWAEEHHLTKVENPEGVKAYAGEGDGGAAWSTLMGSGLYVLALRGPIGTCAVFAEKADTAEAESFVTRLMDRLTAAGTPVAKLKDDTSSTAFGRRHGLVYMVGGLGSPSLRVVSVITNERPGGAYQATLQITLLKRPPPP
jgi:hypothetical protein